MFFKLYSFVIDFLHPVFIRFLMWHNENNYHLFIICVVNIFSETISHLWSIRKGSISFGIISGGRIPRTKILVNLHFQSQFIITLFFQLCFNASLIFYYMFLLFNSSCFKVLSNWGWLTNGNCQNQPNNFNYFFLKIRMFIFLVTKPYQVREVVGKGAYRLTIWKLWYHEPNSVLS